MSSYSPIVCPEFLPPALSQALADGRRWQTPCGDGPLVWHDWGDLRHPAVVLLHGGSSSWTHWLHNIVPLREAGWRVLVCPTCLALATLTCQRVAVTRTICPSTCTKACPC
jgi:hypothetical protein